MPTTEITERKLNLFDIEQSLAMLMADRDEVTDPEEIAAVEQAIRDYVAQEIRKVDGIRAYIRQGETMAAAAKDEAARASAIAAAWKARVDRLKAYCLTVMQEIGQKRLDGRGGYIAVKGNGGLAPLKIQEDVLPEEYRDVTVVMPLNQYNGWREHLLDIGMDIKATCVSVNNERIRASLKDGESVPGAWLLERASHIEVK